MQGLLIVLPALMLAVFGLASLRQDRILAQLEATEQAKQLAADLAGSVLPSVLGLGHAPAEDGELLRTTLSDPERDPVRLYAHQTEPRISWFVNAQDELVYPPPKADLLTPMPLMPERLNETEQRDWEAARKAAYVTRDYQAAVQVYERFLTNQPPDDFAALACYHLGTLWQAQDRFDQAQTWFERVRQEYPEAVGETGFGLKCAAELQLLQFPKPWLSPARRTGLAAAVAAQAILKPSPWSSFLLDKLEELDKPETERHSTAPLATALWRRTWAAHELARRLCRVWQLAQPHEADPATNILGGWLDMSQGPAWLVTSQPRAAGRWYIALAGEQVERIVERVLRAQRRPAYLGLTVEVAGRAFTPGLTNATVLASMSNYGALAAGECPLQVSVYLAQPNRLYARQRARTIWFGSLIALAAAAVLIGFMTAWRAYQRELWLSELKTNFVSSVSHELRAPIAAVRLMAEELEDLGAQAGHKLGEYHRFIVQECRRLSALIENVLDFARHEQGRKQYEFESTDLVALVQETIRLMRAYAEQKHITLTAVIGQEPLTWEVDGRAIQQVLVNLIDNALKHSPPKATVTIGLEVGAERTDIGASPQPIPTEFTSHNASGPPLSDSATLQLWVEDHGDGIPQEEHERIFEQFYRPGSELRRETQGVGLGLAIVKYVTQAHGGRVTVRSAVGQGSRFTVELPARKS
jgi:signal transduction histidine kinase